MLTVGAGCRAAPEGARQFRDVEYAREGDWKLLLDLYLPEKGVEKPPLVVWIHGGGWVAGSKRRVPIDFLLEEGFAVASINYRLAPREVFPAQVHDCKGAIRWLRAHAGEYGFDPDRIGVAGESAGGHLAAMLGTTVGDSNLEGVIGGNVGYSSDVAAVCDLAGPADLAGFADYDRLNGSLSVVRAFLGASVDGAPERVASASPVSYVDGGDAPFLILHAAGDPIVPVEQSRALHARLQAASVPSQLVISPGSAHGWFLLQRRGDTLRPLITAFFRQHLAPDN